jgi:hypothetical protein
LDAAFPFPIGFLSGWSIYAFSNVLSLDGLRKIAVTTNGLIAAGASLALAVIASVPMGDAVRNRKAKAKQALSMAFVAGWAALTYGTTQANKDVSPAFCITGMISIIASMKILWKNRKMGDSWEQEGTLNSYHLLLLLI